MPCSAGPRFSICRQTDRLARRIADSERDEKRGIRETLPCAAAISKPKHTRNGADGERGNRTRKRKTGLT